MTDCVFCRIVSKESPAVIRHESDNVIAFDNTNPVSEYHLLIVPKRHIRSFHDISYEDKDTVFSMIEAVQKLIKKFGLDQGYKLVTKMDRYQNIPHFHWHLLSGNLKSDNVLKKEEFENI
ncbi:HIT domain-containing protein [Patescibacteria group bacterium]